eukprot:134133_1
MTDTLQGSMWKAHHSYFNRDECVAIKVTNRRLQDDQMIVYKGVKCRAFENILTECSILKYISGDEACPNSIVKYVDVFESMEDISLVMVHGGTSLFEFTRRAHEYIRAGMIQISDWHHMVQLIYTQMIESLEYIHSKDVCHFDVSLENFIIANINVQYAEDRKSFKFCFDDDLQCQLCDFGLAEYLKNGDCTSSKYCGKAAYISPEVVHKAKLFDAKKNDIFGIGVCLFMLITGNVPWNTASTDDHRFVEILNGNLMQLLRRWNKEDYVNDDLLELFNAFFQYESNRISIQQIKQCSWLQSTSNQS